MNGHGCHTSLNNCSLKHIIPLPHSPSPPIILWFNRVYKSVHAVAEYPHIIAACETVVPSLE